MDIYGHFDCILQNYHISAEMVKNEKSDLILFLQYCFVIIILQNLYKIAKLTSVLGMTIHYIALQTLLSGKRL